MSRGRPIKQGRPRVVTVATTTTGLRAVIPNPAHRGVSVKPGRSIAWHFTNNSTRVMKMGVARFGIKGKYRAKTPNAARWPHPLVGGNARVQVKSGGRATLTCRLKALGAFPFGNLGNVTYKYSIVDGRGRVLLDPEIEIPNQA
jgi:hypothetical protein